MTCDTKYHSGEVSEPISMGIALSGTSVSMGTNMMAIDISLYKSNMLTLL